MPRHYTKDLPVLPNIPDRFGEQNWRRFEPVLREFVRVFPAPLTFRPKHIATTTAVSRLRDAVRAFLHPANAWDTDIPVDLLISYWPQVKLIPSDDTVTIAQPGDVGRLQKETSVEAIHDNFVVDAEAQPELFKAILLCKHHEVFPNPVTVLNISEAQLVEATELYSNAPLIDNGPQGFTVL